MTQAYLRTQGLGTVIPSAEFRERSVPSGPPKPEPGSFEEALTKASANENARALRGLMAQVPNAARARG